jgi:hypothetical protein
MACGVEKDTESKEVYPYPEDGLVDDPICPIFNLDCQDGRDWRCVVVCHECFHRLDPDMWISRGCWEALSPITPFEELPPYRRHQQFSPEDGWDGFAQIDALVTVIWMELRRKDWIYFNWVDPVCPPTAYRWTSKHDDSRVVMKYEGQRVLEFTIQQGLASDAMAPVISKFGLVHKEVP